MIRPTADHVGCFIFHYQLDTDYSDFFKRSGEAIGLSRENIKWLFYGSYPWGGSLF